MSILFKETCKLLRSEKILCSAFHPESNTGLWKSHRFFAEYLRHYVQEEQSDWDKWIP